jgi:hypothetical protein
MDADALIAAYPQLFHVVAAGSWESLRQHGLRSTDHIVGTGGLPVTTADRLLHERRARSFTFEHPQLGRVTVRDHKPLQLHNLKLPPGVTVPQWLALLNERVFFWVNDERMKGFLAIYGREEHDVITVDTASLVRTHYANIRLSPFNSGATQRPNAPERGEHTFFRIEDYPFAERVRQAGRKKAVAEVTVLGGVPDLAKHVTSVERYRGPTPPPNRAPGGSGGPCQD